MAASSVLPFSDPGLSVPYLYFQMAAKNTNPFWSTHDPSYEDLTLPCNARLDPSVPDLHPDQPHPTLPISSSTHSLSNPFATPPSSPSISPISTPPPAISSDRSARKVGIYGSSSSSLSSLTDESLTSNLLRFQSTKKPSLWTRFWRSLNNQFSPKAFWELIHPKE